MWSKNSVGRSGNGVSVQAKLKSPKPTPNQGCAAMIESGHHHPCSVSVVRLGSMTTGRDAVIPVLPPIVIPATET